MNDKEKLLYNIYNNRTTHPKHVSQIAMECSNLHVKLQKYIYQSK